MTVEITSMTPVEEIVWHEREADRLEQLSAENRRSAGQHRWKAAELIAAELATGKTQRVLAGEIHQNRAHVYRMKEVWTRFAADHGQQERSFDSYYQEVKREPKTKPGRFAGHKIRDGVDPASTQPVTVNLRVTTSPADYNAFKVEAKNRGMSVPELIGTQIAKVAPAAYPVPERNPDAYAPTFDACGPDGGFDVVMGYLTRRLQTTTRNPLLTKEQRTELIAMLSIELNYLTEQNRRENHEL